MPHYAIFRQPTPEELELVRRRAELATLRSALATHEGQLAALRATLFSFEGRYIRQVGVLYIQLDEWNDRIAELNDPTLHLTPSTLEPAPVITLDDSQEQATYNLKSLFREVAKRIHPDFALNSSDERRRTHLMAQANAAFLRDDAALLLRMLHGHDPSSREDIATELARTIDLIDRCAADIIAIQTEIETVTHSDMADLHRRTILAAERGEDLLAELAARVKGVIGIAMRRYELDLGRIRRKQAAFNPEPLLSAEIKDPKPVTPIKLRHLRTPTSSRR